MSSGRRKEKDKTKPAYHNMACLQRLQGMSRNNAQQSRVALLRVSFSNKERITLIMVSFPSSTFSILQLARGHQLQLAHFE